ncbi:MAG: hypothetical protein R3F49_07980 [Planctomycetota bacterium]
MLTLLVRPAAFEHAPLRVVWISGASDPRACGLSDAQAALLRACAADDSVATNFPFVAGRPAREVPLWIASLSNLVQFLSASTPLFRWAAARHWRALCASSERVLVIAGSCGAQLLRALERATPPGVEVRAIALGPVAWRAPACLEVALVGERDRIARPFVRAGGGARVVSVPGVGHMDYLASELVLGAVRGWVRAHMESWSASRAAPTARATVAAMASARQASIDASSATSSWAAR